MKKLLIALTAFAVFSANAESISVAASPVPHAEILEFIKPALAKEGVELQVRVFTDYVQPNMQVQQKHIDANYFQTIPFLDDYNATRKGNLVTIEGVHVEPFGAYSKKIKSLSELQQGATVAIPNDASNVARALLLLQKAQLITLKPNVGSLATQRDIVKNPKNLKLLEVEAATLPRVLGQVDLALINTNYALEAKFNPAKDALVIEGSDSPYVNYLVARPDNKDSAAMQKLAKALQSAEVKQFIKTKYNGAVFPAF